MGKVRYLISFQIDGNTGLLLFKILYHFLIHYFSICVFSVNSSHSKVSPNLIIYLVQLMAIGISSLFVKVYFD